MAFEDKNSPSSGCCTVSSSTAEPVVPEDIPPKVKIEPDHEELEIDSPSSDKSRAYSSYSIDRFVNAIDESKSFKNENAFSSYSISRLVSKEQDIDFRKGDCISKIREQQCNARADDGQNSSSWIKFSVDNILKPDFGTKCETLKRTVTPIMRSNGELRNPRFGVNRRSFEISRLNSNEEYPRRRHSEESHKEETARSSSNSDGELPGSAKTDLWPAWVYCTRYSDRPSSGPRSRRVKRKEKNPEEKRPRTAFSGDQLSRLKHEFNENKYLNEKRRQDLAKELNLNEAQIKIWFQNKRAKMKKAKGEKNPLALQLMAQGLYNHTTVPVDEEEYLEEMALANQTRAS